MFTLLELIVDPAKREAVYKYFDENYVETEEERKNFVAR